MNSRALNSRLKSWRIPYSVRLRLVRGAQMLAQPKVWMQRKNHHYLLGPEPHVDWASAERNGYYQFDPSVFAAPENIVTLCRKLKDERDGDIAPDGQPWTNDFQRSLLTPNDFLRHPELVEWATSDKILNIAARYLGRVPRLASMILWWAPVNGSLDSSQRFHLDLEDVRQAKFFLYLYDVDKDSGPLSCIPATQSAAVKRSLNYKEGKLDDEVLFSVCDPSELVEFTGKAGSITMLDTCRCFHYGSRARGKERLVLMFTFTTGTEVKEPVNDFPPELFAQYDRNPEKRLIVRA